MAGLPAGMYTVRAGKDKFQTQVLDGVVLSSGAAISINLSLKVGTVPQGVTVTADVAIDTITSTVSGELRAEPNRTSAERPRFVQSGYPGTGSRANTQ